jgi:hypothetical protein
MRNLKGREYKLLLDYSRFPAPLTEIKASAFWRKHIVRIIDKRLDDKKGGGSRASGAFDKVGSRKVIFWDTQDGVLAAHDYALRERTADPDDAEAERSLLLKLRVSDMFISGNADLVGEADRKTEFEEDIAPLEVKTVGNAQPPVVLASPPSMRSRFSLSRAVKCTRADFADYAGLSGLFPGLADDLAAQRASPRPKAKLRSGPVVTETAFEGAEVKLGRNVTGEFTLSLWKFDLGEPLPGIGEISFKYAVADGVVPGDVARRAYDLFTGLQEELGDWLNLRYSSKTELALPGRNPG